MVHECECSRFLVPGGLKPTADTSDTAATHQKLILRKGAIRVLDGYRTDTLGGVIEMVATGGRPPSTSINILLSWWG